MGSLVGFRFQPTDEELILLLKRKRLYPDFSVDTITEIDFYNFEPWELPGFCAIQSQEEVWYFFCEPSKYAKSERVPNKYAESKRVHRRTKTGYWKVTGQGSKMKAKKSHGVIGNKRILSFCSSKNPITKWVMHEISVVYSDDHIYKDFVICRLERKRNKKLRISTSNENQSSPDLGSYSSIDVTENVVLESAIPVYHVAENIFSKMKTSISNLRNHVAENTSPKSILPPPQHLDSNRNHVAENTNLVSLPSDHLISNSRNQNICAEPTPLAKFNPHNGDNGLNDDWALQSPFYPDSSSSSNGWDYLLNSPVFNEPVDDLINSLGDFQNESSHEEPAQTFTPDFKSSKSDENAREATGQTSSPDFSSKSDGVYVENISDMDTEAFCAWAKASFEDKQIHSIY